MKKKRVAIIGAGAAGCFAAANIPYSDACEVIVFEKTGKALQKVKVSGGGRCNVTHSLFDVSELTGRYPRGKNFLRKTLYEFGPQDTIEWFEKRGVMLKTEGDGRMFPATDNSQTIIDCIWQEMMQQRVEVQYHKAVEKIEQKKEGFEIHFTDSSVYQSDKILIACGGFSKETQYSWLKETGHTIQLPVPSLFTFNLPKHPVTALMGISVPEVTVKVMGTKIVEQGSLLITHWGLSGPVILRASAWGARELYERYYDFLVQINWLCNTKEEALRERFRRMRSEQGKQNVCHKNPFALPKRLWEFLLDQSGIKKEIRWGELPAQQQHKLIEHLLHHIFRVSGKTTFKEEFVTCGGVSLSEIDPKTMESKLMKGLYFAGEIVDVDGITGGFNFQHAWASGYIAAKAAAI